MASPVRKEDDGDSGGFSSYNGLSASTKHPISVDVDPEYHNKSRRNWQWCLLTLDGNATIVQLRRDDFIRYVRMNVASLIGSDYDSVIFNAISYSPEILVNLTLDWHGRSRRIVSTLSSLAEHNDTLLDLSGSHFNVTDFLPWSTILAPKPVGPLGNPHGMDPKEIEGLIYMCVGAVVIFLLGASLFFAICQCVSKPKGSNSKLVRSEESNGHLLASQYSLDDGRRSSQGRQPKLIYSQSFSDGLCQDGRPYTPLDENLAPLASFEGEDFIPRFVHSQSETRFHHLPEERRPQPPPSSCGHHQNGYPLESSIRRPQSRRQSNCDSQSDIIAIRRPIYGVRKNSDVPSDSQSDIVKRTRFASTTPIPQFADELDGSGPANGTHHLHHHHHHHRLSRGGYLPMDPVFQTVTVEPRVGPRSCLPSRPSSRMTSDSLPSSKSFTSGYQLSSFKPEPPTAEEIARDVKIVLRNMGLEQPSPEADRK